MPFYLSTATSSVRRSGMRERAPTLTTEQAIKRSPWRLDSRLGKDGTLVAIWAHRGRFGASGRTQPQTTRGRNHETVLDDRAFGGDAGQRAGGVRGPRARRAR